MAPDGNVVLFFRDPGFLRDLIGSIEILAFLRGTTKAIKTIFKTL